MIGAGVAGLAAARDLGQRGASVVVLEGRARIGGRVWTSDALGTPIDLGASWIHGVKGNPIVALADELGVQTRATDYQNLYLYDADGTRLSDRDVATLYGEWESLLEVVEAAAESLPKNASVADAFAAALDGVSLDPLEARGVGWLKAGLVVAAAAELSRLSLSADDDEGFPGGDRLFPGGYHQIVKHLASGLDIRFGQTVKRVEVKAGGVRVSTQRETFDAEHVVVTASLGVLQSESIEFAPVLEPAKLDAIAGLEMGTLNKVALRFPRRFWPDGRDFIGSMARTSGQYPTIMNWHHYTKEPVLIAFTGGDFARELEARKDEVVAGDVVAILRKIYGARVPDPTGVAVSRWASDPLARGAYAHVPPGSSSAVYDALAQPVGDRLFFAGEATHREQRGTVHGAYLSGLREADRIAALRG